MIAAVADTHTLIWYAFGDPRLSRTAYNFMEDAAHREDKIAISSISFVEMIVTTSTMSS